MASLETIVPLVVEAVCGATGGLAFGHWVNSASLGRGINALAGAVGGLLLTWLVARTPWVDRLVGGAAASDAALTPSLVIGVGVAGLLGGALFTLALALLRKSAGTWDV
ncbi:hypothetical protein [Aminobacter sp. HY435]|uniref:hypothetical protein n=1 Tax=Aminobacter sp. HY435 TaxID=2970917 RepID=UPI0022B9BBF0|nr:hypothetical protein [Aminobacter sp. HY435]